MEDYNYLLNLIKECNEEIHGIFNRRMSVYELLHSLENKTNNKHDGYAEIKDRYEKEYNYFKKNLISIDTNFKYNKIVSNNNICFINQDLQDVKTVCYQGIPFSYSEAASKALFKDKSLISKTSFEEVFETVNEGTADIGVVPIENSTAGYINDVYDLLLKYDLYINYSYIKKVDHCLAGIKNSSIENINEVYSHPQAIMQCYEYIEKYNFKTVNENNTAVAAKKIFSMNNENTACICSPEAAEHYGLKIFEKQINQQKQNYTRFAAISKSLFLEARHNRISIVFTVPHRIGTLSDVLSVFTYHNINLLSIYSRPDLKNPWNYMFYLDFEGNLQDVEIKAILNQFNEELPFIKILGSYKA